MTVSLLRPVALAMARVLMPASRSEVTTTGRSSRGGVEGVGLAALFLGVRDPRALGCQLVGDGGLNKLFESRWYALQTLGDNAPAAALDVRRAERTAREHEAGRRRAERTDRSATESDIDIRSGDFREGHRR